MSIEQRIFLESKIVYDPFFGIDTGYRHLYLVRRNVNVADGVYNVIVSDDDRAIRGGPRSVFLGAVEAALKSTLDNYNSNESPTQRWSTDITAIVRAGVFSSVEAAWQAMTSYAAGINTNNYEYDIPTTKGFIANSNAIIFSVLNYAGVEARDILRDGTNQFYIDYVHPGASAEFGSTILASASEEELVASSKLKSGVSLVGSDLVDDVMRGTQFADRFFGGQNFLHRGNDTVNLDHIEGNIDISLKLSDLSQLVYGRGLELHSNNYASSSVEADTLFGIENLQFGDGNDTVRIDESAIKSKIDIDMGGSDWNSGLEADFIRGRDTADFSKLTTGIVYNNGKIGYNLYGKYTIYQNITFSDVEKLILTSSDDEVVSTDLATIVETGNGNDKIWLGSGLVAVSDLSSSDRITIFGIDFLTLYGGIRYKNSNSPYAYGWNGMIQYGLNSQGELQIKMEVGGAALGEIWVLNYGDASRGANKPGGINLYEVDIIAKRLMDPWPAGYSIGQTWDLFAIIAKVNFGLKLWQGVDPLVLDLDGDGLELATKSTVSARFDIDGDSYAELTGWVKPDDGMLVRDLNGNGIIDDVTEMFGNSTTGGFAALAQLDRNGDGKVDAADDIEDLDGNGVIDGTETAIAAGRHFSDLRVWRDRDQDGETDADELFTLAELGIQSISTAKADHSEHINGNTVSAVGSFTRLDGTTGTVGDVVFQIDNIYTEYAGPAITVTSEAMALPDLKGRGTLVSLRQAMSISADARTAVEAALPDLTMVDLVGLRAATTPILGAWAQASPLTDDDGDVATNPAKLNPHEDLHILVRTDDNGRQAVVDVAFRTSTIVIDGSGQHEIPHWAKASGKAVYAASGALILYPTLEQLLASDVGRSEAWQIIDPVLIGVTERMIGELLPLDAVQAPGTHSFPGLIDIANSLLATIDLAVVRIAVQDGPLARFFAGIEYDVETDKFVPTTNADLAPVYIAIIQEADTNSLGADWLHSWRPLLDRVLGDYVRSGGEGLLNTFGFLAQNLVSAFETVQPSLDFRSIALAFGVPDYVLVTGAGTVAGSLDNDIIYATAPNAVLRGGLGGDEYIFGKNIGHSIIDDVEGPLASAYDILRLPFLDPGEIVATRAGTDFIITVLATGETIRILRQFEGELPGLFGGDLSPDTGVNEIVFADGTVWLKADMAKAVSHVDDGATTVEGTEDNDYLDGGAGDDVLKGAGDGDVYVFAKGYGNDRIEDLENFILRPVIDILKLRGLTVDDVTFDRIGESSDLLIKINETGETLTIKDQFVATYTGVFGVQWLSRIEAILLGDGRSMSADSVMAHIVAGKGTAGDDVIYGFSAADRLDGGAGDDYLTGGNENDTYVFGIGYDHDVIQDQLTNILSDEDDTLEFTSGLTVDDVVFSRDGESMDLKISLTGYPDTLTIVGFYRVTETGVFGSHAFDLIERFEWADGTVKLWSVVQREMIEAARTTGNDFIAGTHFDDVIDGGAGNDVLKGWNGSDRYIFKQGYGHDQIIDENTNILAGDDDRVVFAGGILAQDVTLERFGSDLEGMRFTLAGGDTLAIEQQWSYTSINYRPNEVEWFEFSDGTVWSARDLRNAYLSRHSTSGDDVIDGFWSSDVIEGGAGNDLLRGADGSDIYRFNAGFGQDVIDERVVNVMYDDQDVVDFGSQISAADARLSRQGDDLIIGFDGASDQITVRDQFKTGGFFSGQNDIELIRFADGTEWTAADIRLRLLAQQQTAGNDTVTGFYTADRIDGGGGDDILRGQGGSDVYVFGLGSGSDTIEESLTSVWDDNPDAIEFAASITVAAVRFFRDGFDLRISIDSAADTLTIHDHFRPNSFAAVEFFRFADGTVVTAAQIETGQERFVATPDDGTVTGTGGNDTIDGGIGNDVLKGKDGSDTYTFSSGFGQDRIEESVDNVLNSDDDKVLFGPDFNSADARLQRIGDDLLITFVNRPEQLRVVGQFAHGAWFDSWTDIELFTFGDGVRWTDADIRAKLLQQSITSGNDVIDGYWMNDELDGGTGNDVLRGQGGGDIYWFGRGSGNDIVEDSVTNIYEDYADSIRFKSGVERDDVRFRKVGDDLLVTIRNAPDSILIKSQFGSEYRRVERFDFIDGSSVSWQDAAQLAVVSQKTDGDDVIEGTSGEDALEGGRGNDDLNGASGNDSYRYHRGDGNDVIREDGIYQGTADSLALVAIDEAKVSLQRTGDDLVLIIAESGVGAADGGQIVLKNQLDGDYNRGLEAILFDSGERWSADDLRFKLLSQASTTGNDIVEGFKTADTIDGSQGNDVLIGHGGNDTYVYARGDGNDVVDESGIYEGTVDKIVFSDINAAEVKLELLGDDLRLVVAESARGRSDGGTLTLKAQLNGLYDRGLETITFADGVNWIKADLVSLAAGVVANGGATHLGTDTAETINGSVGSDIVDGRAGADVVTGDAGSDTYRFGIGSGSDTIIENYAPSDIDVVRLKGLNPEDVSLVRQGDNLSIVIIASGDMVEVRNHFLTGGYGIEQIAFANDVVWDRAAILAASVISGTSGNDVLNGTAQNDVFRGRAGDDRFNSAAGSDTFIYAHGDGNDYIDEESGSNAEIDVLRFVDLNASELRLTRSGLHLLVTIAATGETITVDEQFYSATAKWGIERFEFADGTSWDRNQIKASAWLRGTPGDDTILGTTESDTIIGNAGNDVISDAGGSDVFIYRSGDGHDRIVDTSSASGETDTLQLVDLNVVDLIFSRTATNLFIEVAATGHIVTIVDQFGGSSKGLEQISFVDGTAWSRADIESRVVTYADTLTGTPGDDELVGTSAADVISGRQGNDVLRGGAGSDTYRYNVGDGLDQIYEGFGYGELDTIALGDGVNAADVRVARSGYEGDDLMISFANVGGSIFVDVGFYNAFYGFGIEQLSFANGMVWNAEDLRVAYLTQIQTSDNDVIYGFKNNADLLTGGAGDDTLRGLNGGDTYQYNIGDGQDQVVEDYGYGDVDKVAFGAGLNATNVVLTRSGYQGDDLAISFNGVGGSVFVKNAFYNSTYGYGVEQLAFADGTTWGVTELRAAYLASAQTAGNDTIYGYKEVADTLAGGSGDDILRGQTGSDTYAYNLGDGNDQIYEDYGYGDTDRVVFGSGLDASNIDVVRSINSLTLSFSGVAGSLYIDNAAYGSTYGIEQYVFADGTTWGVSDLLARAWYRGTSGNDYVSASAGDDRIDAGGGNDYVWAGSGNDIIFGSSGDDTLAGEGGNDVFVFASGFGKDTITDFVAGSATDDVIEFDDAVFADLSAVLAASSQVGSDTLITYDASNTLTLKNVTKTSLSADDFRFV